MTILIPTTTPQIALKHVLPSYTPDLPDPDIIWVNPESEIITIEQIRELQLRLVEPPYKAEKKQLIFTNLELSSLEVQNALLKTFEEPPAHVQCVLLSSNPQMLLGTIRSRCEYVKIEINISKDILIDQNFTETLSKKTLSEKIALAEQYTDRAEAQRFVIAFIHQLHTELEIKPSLNIIQYIKHAQDSLKMLQANVGVKLAIEWMLFKIV